MKRITCSRRWPNFSRFVAIIIFYHNNAIWPWRIAADGEVTNANA